MILLLLLQLELHISHGSESANQSCCKLCYCSWVQLPGGGTAALPPGLLGLLDCLDSPDTLLQNGALSAKKHSSSQPHNLNIDCWRHPIRLKQTNKKANPGKQAWCWRWCFTSVVSVPITTSLVISAKVCWPLGCFFTRSKGTDTWPIRPSAETSGVHQTAISHFLQSSD